jgi:hypothetical protein
MPRLKPWTHFTLLLLSFGLTTCLSAQDVVSGETHVDSRVDFYGGYGYFRPVLNSGINGYAYPEIHNPNAVLNLSVFLNRYIGVQVEGSYISGGQNKPFGTCLAENCSQLVYTAEAGPVLRLPLGPFVPFVHVLGGGERTNGPANQPLTWGWGVTGGGGIDIVLPPFHHLFAIRPIQADFQYSQADHGPLVLPSGTVGGQGDLYNLKLSGGLVVRFGDFTPPYPVMLGCGSDPSSVYPGDPVTITSTALHTDPKKNPTYSWQTTGGKILPSGSGATVDTTGATPGAFIVTGHIEEGSKARQQASCQAPFTVKEFDPPTIACAANPTTGISGTDFTITASAMSPQKRSLTYSYAATTGIVAGAGPTAKLSTAGLSPSTITVTCTAADDVSHTASATADIVLTAPPVPVIPQTQQLCSLSFARDAKRPVRVDNEAKGCLDDIALTLNKETDARLVIVGSSAPGEKPAAAAERTLNARQYLTQEKGIDPSRVELRTGDATDKAATTTLVPPGAIFNDLNTHTFDEKTIVRHGQAYGAKTPAKSPKATP